MSQFYNVDSTRIRNYMDLDKDTSIMEIFITEISQEISLKEKGF
jgi:hypothetical protein